MADIGKFEVFTFGNVYIWKRIPIILKGVKKGKKCDYFRNTNPKGGENSDSLRWHIAVLHFVNICGEFTS